MNDQQWLDVIGTEGAAFAACVDRGPLDRRVPGCPDWDLAQLVEHLGNVHRRVARVAQRPVDETTAVELSTAPEGAAELAQWSRDGLQEVLDALSDDPEVIVATFAGPQPRRWWRRRQAHETALHRWDAESAVGTPSPIEPPELAVDGIEELFEIRLGGSRPEDLGVDGATAHLHATDTEGEWLLTFDPDGVRIEREHRKGDVAARGTASDLLLFLYGRVPADRLEVFGDAAILDRWQAVIHI